MSHNKGMLEVPDNDPINPNHYKFPDGTEVIQVTRWLNSNGGQAVGYIARTTRLDGCIKGKAIEDLEKAIWLITDEIERLKGEQERAGN